MLELLFVLALASILAAAAVPQLLAGVDRARATGAAKYLAQRCGMARLQAVARGTHVALQFTRRNGEYDVQLFADGNGNGVRSSDIMSGVDAPVTAAETLSGHFPGVRIALDPALGLGTEPVRLGGSALWSFTPLGTSTAGTVYVLGRDGTQLAVRGLGVTGRTRVLRYEPATDSWEQP